MEALVFRHHTIHHNRSIWRERCGQSIIETAILFMIIIIALISMQIYLKRGIQGRLRIGADSIGEQYDPQLTSSDYVLNHVSNVTTISQGHEENDTITGDTRLITTTTSQTHYDNSTKSGYESVGAQI